MKMPFIDICDGPAAYTVWVWRFLIEMRRDKSDKPVWPKSIEFYPNYDEPLREWISRRRPLFLCRVGFHDWQIIRSGVHADEYQCRRCGVEHIFGNF